MCTNISKCKKHEDNSHTNADYGDETLNEIDNTQKEKLLLKDSDILVNKIACNNVTLASGSATLSYFKHQLSMREFVIKHMTDKRQ